MQLRSAAQKQAEGPRHSASTWAFEKITEVLKGYHAGPLDEPVVRDVVTVVDEIVDSGCFEEQVPLAALISYAIDLWEKDEHVSKTQAKAKDVQRHGWSEENSDQLNKALTAECEDEGDGSLLSDGHV